MLANSAVASVLILLHILYLSASEESCLASPYTVHSFLTQPLSRSIGPLLPLGVIAHYAAATADTFSSELGILSTTPPVLLFAFPPRLVPRGTNGGITRLGLIAGALGAGIIGIVAVLFTPLCYGWGVTEKIRLVGLTAGWGVLGSLLDSLLGAVLQASVVETHSGKIIEGEAGAKVLLIRGGTGTVQAQEAEERKRRGSRAVVSGFDVLSNNGVNFTMSCIMSLGAMAVWSWYLG